MDPETSLRTLGIVLQLAGVAFIAIGIHDTRARFTDRPGVMGTMRRWMTRAMRRVLWWRRPKASGEFLVAESADVSSAAGDATIVKSLDDLSVEEALRELEDRIKATNERVSTIRSELRDQISEVRKAVQDERAKRENDLGDLRDLVQELAAAPLRLEAAGATMILVGIALAAWPWAPVQAWRWAEMVLRGLGG